MELLFQVGAKVEFDVASKANFNVRAALHIAADAGQVPAAEFLYNANIGAARRQTEAALPLAVKHGHLPMVEFLLEHGARFSESAPAMKTTHFNDYRINSHNHDMVHLLLRKEAGIEDPSLYHIRFLCSWDYSGSHLSLSDYSGSGSSRQHTGPVKEVFLSRVMSESLFELGKYGKKNIDSPSSKSKSKSWIVYQMMQAWSEFDEQMVESVQARLSKNSEI
jgi:hypothetical protein